MLFFFILLIYSCIDRIAPDPPVVEITPDSILEISPTNSAVFRIKVTSEEDLKSFVLDSRPNIFVIDSTFYGFVHETNIYLKLEMPEVVYGLDADSLVTLFFSISDSQTKVKTEQYVKIVRGYTDILLDTIVMTSQTDGYLFYSATNSAIYTYVEGMDMSDIDFVFLYDEDRHFILCSPDAPIITDKLAEAEIEYVTENQNHTTMTSFLNTYWVNIDYKVIYNLIPVDEYIDGIPTLGVGIANLTNPNIIAFETHNNRKGVIQIMQTYKNDKQIKFVIKIQNP